MNGHPDKCHEYETPVQELFGQSRRAGQRRIDQSFRFEFRGMIFSVIAKREPRCPSGILETLRKPTT